MIMYRIINSLLVICVILHSGCTGLKKLPPGEKLYTGARIKLEYNGDIKKKKEIIAKAKSAVRPDANQSFLGMRPKLWIYQQAGEPKKNGLRKKLKEQGEPPVLASSIKPGETAKYIDAKLFNAGIFGAATDYKIIEHKRTMEIVYTSKVHIPFKIKDIIYKPEHFKIDSLITSQKKHSILKGGDNYDLDIIKKERERLDVVLKDNGFYYFNPEYFLFHVDTSSVDKTVNLTLVIKKDIPESAFQIFKIGNVVINADYSLENRKQNDSVQRKSTIIDSVTFLGENISVKPWVILQNVSLKKHNLYSRKKHNNTLNRLMNIGPYKFVRVKFTEDSVNNHLLNMKIFLTPMPKRTLRTEANMVSKSNDFIGPQLNLSYQNRNAFRGAELLNVTIGGSYETQISGKYKNLFSYSLNSKVELIFPRFVVPVPLNDPNNYYVPKTKFSVGYNYLKRIEYFDLRSLQFIYGFKWKESAAKDHDLNPISINIVSIDNQTAAFNELLITNPFIRKSYDEQFIAGLQYSFLYNEQLLPKKRNQLYFNLFTETSGNSISLVNKLMGKEINADNPLKLGGLIYSQFGKISGDLRNYVNYKNTRFVTRLFAGVGKAYGNSSTMPYIKQFFSGGANSVRAFPINSLGPGTHSLETGGAALFLQQGGDIKLEGNVEYRFDIFRSFKGAVFTDAGNVWLFKTNPAVNEPPFSIGEFYNEIAVGVGMGLRLDITFFVLRFDLATPLRKPYLPKNERWVVDKINFSDASWRGENLILNVAIGYPF